MNVAFARSERVDRRAVPVAAAMAVAAATAAMGLWRLAHQGLWPDEGFSVRAAQLELPTLFRLLTIDESYNALYYGLLHVWQWGGSGEVWLRLPSVLCGVGAATTLFVLNDRLFGRAVATVAAVLLAANVFFIRYMQEVRGYALAVFLTVLASYAFVAALDRPTFRRWMIYGILGALAIYAHIFAGFVIAAHLLSLTMRPARPPLGPMLGAGIVTAALLIPLAALMRSTESRGQGFVQVASVDALESLFLSLTGAGGIPSRGPRLLLLLYFLLCVIALTAMVWRSRGRHPERADARWAYGLAVLWLAVPVLSSLAVAFEYATFHSRYLLITVPALVTLAALGISAMPHWTVRTMAVAAVLVLSSPQLEAYYRTPLKEGGDWRSAAAYVASHRQPGDRIVFVSRYGRWAIEYHLGRLGGLDGLVPLYPYQAWGAFTPVLGDRPPEPTTLVASQLRDVTRVWVLLLWGGFDSRAEDAAPIRATLEEAFTKVAAASFGPSLEARLYQKRQ